MSLQIQYIIPPILPFRHWGPATCCPGEAFWWGSGSRCAERYICLYSKKKKKKNQIEVEPPMPMMIVCGYMRFIGCFPLSSQNQHLLLCSLARFFIFSTHSLIRWTWLTAPPLAQASLTAYTVWMHVNLSMYLCIVLLIIPEEPI